jgi:DNA-binding transcriptional regulator YhcF (GntR family)
MEHPITTSNWLVEKAGLKPATVNKSLVNLEQLGIVEREVTVVQVRMRLGARDVEDRDAAEALAAHRRMPCRILSFGLLATLTNQLAGEILPSNQSRDWWRGAHCSNL